MRWSLVGSVCVTHWLLLSSLSWAQDGQGRACPPGRLCESVPVDVDEMESPRSTSPGIGQAPAQPAESGVEVVGDAPDDGTDGLQEGTGLRGTRSAMPSESPSAQPLGVLRPYDPSPVPAPPPRARYRRRIGVTGRLQVAYLGAKAVDESTMGGLGAAFHFRPVAPLAFEAGVDFLGGRDWEGNSRREVALSGNVLVFVNSADSVEPYLLAGLMLSQADVELRPSDPSAERDSRPKYSYFGGQLGVGLKWHLRPRLALDVDLVAFMRGRTDPRAGSEPEFVHPDTGVGTNVSGGGLFRAGVSFYF